MTIKLILPSLTEAGSPNWSPIKYSLFPPLGLATLAAHFSVNDDIEIVDEHVESLNCVVHLAGENQAIKTDLKKTA